MIAPALTAAGATALTFLDTNGSGITALATIVIAAFTATLWRATVSQAKLTRQSIDLARDELQRAYRAKLAIRRIHSPQFFRGKGIAVKVDMLNHGVRDAVVVASGADIFLRPKLPTERRSFDANIVPTSTKTSLKPGAMYSFAAEGSNVLSADDIGKIARGEIDAIFIGNMLYTDDAGLQVISFFRIYDHVTGCFRRAETAAESQEWDYTD